MSNPPNFNYNRTKVYLIVKYGSIDAAIELFMHDKITGGKLELELVAAFFEEHAERARYPDRPKKG